MNKKEKTNNKNDIDKEEESVVEENSAHTPMSTNPNQNPVTFKEVTAFIKRELKRNLVLVIALLILGLGALAYNYRSLVIAATVNGKPIFRWQIISLLEKQMGESALDSLVERRLVENEAKTKNVVVSDDEINSRVQTIKDSVSQQGMTFSNWLESNKLTEDDFKKQLKSLILVEKLLQDKLNVTDEESNQFIETYKGSGINDDEEGRSIAMEQIKQQKLATEYTAFIEGLKKSQSVNILIKY